MDKAVLISEAAPVLKEMGYKKRGSTWAKYSGDIVIVVNIQGSQFDSSGFYVNLGVYVIPLGAEKFPCISRCHMQERVQQEIKSTDFFIDVVKRWEEWYGSPERIRERIVQGKLPMLMDRRLAGYILTGEMKK